MKKVISLLIIGLLLIIPLVDGYAAEGDVFEKSCGTSPNFGSLLPEGKLNHNEFDAILEDAQVQYHSYISCLFGVAFSHVLRQKGNSTKGELSAQINTINWMLPGEACISEAELIDSIKATAPSELMPNALGALSSYQLFLSEMNQKLPDVQPGTVDQKIIDRAGSPVQQRSLIIQERQNRINEEAQSTLIALKIAFNALKELRFSFVFHVRLQCILNQLGAYQKQLGELRGMMGGLPNALKNASVNP